MSTDLTITSCKYCGQKIKLLDPSYGALGHWSHLSLDASGACGHWAEPLIETAKSAQ